MGQADEGEAIHGAHPELMERAQTERAEHALPNERGPRTLVGMVGSRK